MCWPPTPAGEKAEQICPSLHGFDASSKHGFKYGFSVGQDGRVTSDDRYLNGVLYKTLYTILCEYGLRFR